MDLALLPVSPWTRAVEAPLQSTGRDILVLRERSLRSSLDTWASVSCCTMAWGSADGLEKLDMKNDSNRP